MGNDDHGERLAAMEVEVTNLKERVSKMEKGTWAVVLAVFGYIITQIMQKLNVQ